MQQTALSFSKNEGHCSVQLARIIRRFTPDSWRVMPPQLMGRAVRRHRQQIAMKDVDMGAPEDRDGTISRYRKGPILLERAVRRLQDADLDAMPMGGG
jgi:hypothetical protein